MPWQAWLARRKSEKVVVPAKPGNAGGGKGLHFWLLSKEPRTGRLAMSLQTPTKIRTLQEEALLQGEGGAGIPLLPALRQGLARGHSRSCVVVGESERRRTGC